MTVTAARVEPPPPDDPLWIDLLARRGASGGFRARAESAPELETTDATAWATLALALASPRSAERLAAGAWLARHQGEDGRLSTHPLHPGSYAPTAIAILAWSGDAARAGDRRQALDFLLSHAGITYPRDPDSPNRIDTEVAGWPWVDRTFSWAEPTALALLALAAAGLGDHPRAHDGVRVLLDRQIPSGGWNYGNSRVFDAELLHAPESTALVLAALAEYPRLVERETVARSIARLESDLPRLRTPLALGWSLLAAAAWKLDRAASERDRGIAETLARAGRYGGYDTADLALLVVARAAPRGLGAALAHAEVAAERGATR